MHWCIPILFYANASYVLFRVVPQSDLREENDDEGLPMFQIFYDFKPADFDDPVLLFFEGKTA